MNAMFVLERCRSYSAETDELAAQIRRRMDMLSMGAGTGLEDEIKTLKAELAARKKARSAELKAAAALIDMLPEVCARYMHRYYVKSQSLPAIAYAERVSHNTVRGQLRRGKTKLASLTHRQVSGLLPGWYVEKYNERSMTDGDSE